MRGEKRTFHRALLALILCLSTSGIARAALPQGQVLTGVDVLVQENFAPLKGRKIGLVTNQTGRTRDGRSTIDVLYRAPGVKLVALFGPEHGVRGDVAAGGRVRNSRDAQTDLPVYSLYGSTLKPNSAMLQGIDTMVFDIQDIGSRSYTYISTMGKVMEACAARGLKFIVLDRPNPVGGLQIEGNIPENGFRSFVSPYPIPYRHGLTIGELAWMLNGRGWLAGGKACDLSVIRMKNYGRDMLWPDTGLPWIRTSPNIPQPDSPLFYASTGIVGELSALSIGIGTKQQFELAGAPGLDAAKLAAALNRRNLPGVRFAPGEWKPTSGAFRGRTCRGVKIQFTDPSKVSLTRINFEIMAAVRQIAPRVSFFGSSSRNRMFDLVCGTDDVRQMFQSGKSASQIWSRWNSAAPAFNQLRQKYLLYRASWSQ